MANNQVFEILLANTPYMLIGCILIICIMFCMLISFYFKLNNVQKRFRKMMSGVDNSANLENMLLSHIDETRKVAEDNEKIVEELQRLNRILNTAITKVGVVRFCAFEDMGSDLSYAVAMLDARNNGLVMSSLFGRQDSRSYVKPIENGTSSYTLTKEEQEALQQAMAQKRD